MAERISVTITSELFDDPVQEASIKANLTVRDLIQETLTEFSLPDGSYSLLLENSNKPLLPSQNLKESGVQTGASLVFRREQGHTRAMARISATHRQLITEATQPVLREIQTGKEFTINWQPAIIGRPDKHNPDSKERLAIDVESLPDAQTVSRKHASIGVDDQGRYFIEGLNSHNPTFVGSRALAPGEKYMLKPGEVITLGKVQFQFEMR